jgi:hypothetical protein
MVIAAFNVNYRSVVKRHGEERIDPPAVANPLSFSTNRAVALRSPSDGDSVPSQTGSRPPFCMVHATMKFDSARITDSDFSVIRVEETRWR